MGAEEKNLKILYYIHNLGIGGAETIVVNYLTALKKCGHKVALVVNDETDSFLTQNLSSQNIRIIPLRPGRSENPVKKLQKGVWRYTNYYLKKWNQIIKTESPDVLHIHTAVNLLPDIDFPSDRMVYTFHGDVARYIDIHGEKNFRRIYKYAQSGMSFFSLSSKMSAEINRYFNTDRIKYIPNGVDLLEIRRNKYERSTFLKEYGIAPDAFVLGHVGRFHPVKNQIRVVEIFKELLKKRPNAYLLFVGDGHADYQKQVKEKADYLNLQDRVLFLGMRSDAVQIISVLDTLILPSVSESFSLVLVEAQAQGIRAVASKAVPEEVVCSNNCFRLGLEETNEVWADCLLSEQVEEKSRKIEDFSIESVVEKMVQCYEKITDGDETL